MIKPIDKDKALPTSMSITIIQDKINKIIDAINKLEAIQTSLLNDCCLQELRPHLDMLEGSIKFGQHYDLRLKKRLDKLEQQFEEQDIPTLNQAIDSIDEQQEKHEARLLKLEQQMKEHTHTNYGYDKPTVSKTESVDKSCENCGNYFNNQCNIGHIVCIRKNYWQPKDQPNDNGSFINKVWREHQELKQVIKEVYELAEDNSCGCSDCNWKEILDKLRPYVDGQEE